MSFCLCQRDGVGEPGLSHNFFAGTGKWRQGRGPLTPAEFRFRWEASPELNVGHTENCCTITPHSLRHRRWFESPHPGFVSEAPLPIQALGTV